MKIKKGILSLISLLLVFSLAVAFLGFTGCSKKSKEKKVIKIGAILPLTGNLAALGENEKNVLLLAQREINKQHILGSRLLLVFEDASTPTNAASATNKLVAEGVRIILVSTTPLAAATIPIADSADALTVVHSMTNRLVNQGKLVLRIYPSILDEIQTLGTWFEKEGITSLAILRLKSEWSSKWVQEFHKNYPKVKIWEEEYEMGKFEQIRNLLLKIKSYHPQALLLLGYGNSYPVILQKIRETRIETEIYGNIGFTYASTKIEAKKIKEPFILDNCKFPIFEIPLTSPEVKRLEKEYSDNFHSSLLEEPGALYFYDTLMLLSKTIVKVGLKPKAIKHYIIEQRLYQGITGHIYFLSNGDVEIPLRMATYKNGKLTFLPQ